MKGTIGLAFFSLFFICACTGTRSADMGAQDSRLRPCPDRPNCVSSQSADPRHAIRPLSYQGTRPDANERLLKLLGSMPRVQVVTATPDYIHAKFASRVFRFVDDVEFVFDGADKNIQVRSAARLGYSDFGVNRKRVETIRDAFEKVQ
ncbi:MAG: DUF1499 domain-containing protein [Syntrophales bacterium]|jgi:uncharacterized protein (DUF1499 family)|nr:DUF1499 domain-containing protein [Syntrophales bacterium]